MIIMTRSTDSTPICAPQLPPLIVKNAGALHPPFGNRQVATPRPCLPAMINPPLTRPGTTATHLAPLNTSSGIPLSGAARIWCKVVVELCRRSSTSVFVWSLHTTPAALNKTSRKKQSFVIMKCPPVYFADTVATIIDRDRLLQYRGDAVCRARKSLYDPEARCRS